MAISLYATTACHLNRSYCGRSSRKRPMSFLLFMCCWEKIRGKVATFKVRSAHLCQWSCSSTAEWSNWNRKMFLYSSKIIPIWQHPPTKGEQWAMIPIRSHKAILWVFPSHVVQAMSQATRKDITAPASSWASMGPWVFQGLGFPSVPNKKWQQTSLNFI